MANSKKSIALVLSIFLLVILFSFVGLSAYQYMSDSRIQRYYETSLQTLYDIEVAKIALLWEEAHSPIPNNWDTDEADGTYDSLNRLQGSDIDDGDGFYRLTLNNHQYTFRAKVLNSGQEVVMYIHGFQGSEASPENSQYLEYVHAPSPMYRFAMFSNADMIFEGEMLYEINGGRIHTNGDIRFRPRYGGIRFADIAEMTASGTIKYDQKYTYPSSNLFDNLDNNPSDGMAPAPYPYDEYVNTTAKEDLMPGPFRQWTNIDGAWNLDWRLRGNYLGHPYGNNGHEPMPLAWLGEDTYFYGKQYGGAVYSPYWGEDGEHYLDNLGNRYSSSVGTIPIYQANYDYGAEELQIINNNEGRYYNGDIYFKPSVDKLGNTNDAWFSMPGALDQQYEWGSKYNYKDYYAQDTNLEFYATETCNGGSAGCLPVEDGPNDTDESWRYIKQDSGGVRCFDDACYNAPDSTYVKAQDYMVQTDTPNPTYNICVWNNCGSERADIFQCLIIDGGDEESCAQEIIDFNRCKEANNCSQYTKVPYFDAFTKEEHDINNDMFDDYTYGTDRDDADSMYRLIRALNAEEQPDGFSEYLSLLSQQNIEGVVDYGVPEKEPYLGRIFDEGTDDSPYKLKAQDSGLYIDDISGAVSDLNAGLPVSQEFAKAVSFYNWKTAQEVQLIEIDVDKMKASGRNPVNGVIYSEVPLRLTNAENLPGTNAGNKKAVFTVIGEESVYLKGNYNSQDWKISNIATKKKVYTLSDEFEDRTEAPDWAIYPEYPYIYMKAEKDSDTGEVINYLHQEGDPEDEDANNGHGDGVWINRYSADDKHTDGQYKYYFDMTQGDRNWIYNKFTQEQDDYAQSDINPPNRVCSAGSASCEYEYNSLFLTPYDSGQGDHSLENWKYCTNPSCTQEAAATKIMNGAFLNFAENTSPTAADEDYREQLSGTPEYYSVSGESYSGINLRRGGQTDYESKRYGYYVLTRGSGGNPSLRQSYDPRFPQATPASSAGVLGFTGGNSWRFITEQYFNDHI